MKNPGHPISLLTFSITKNALRTRDEETQDCLRLQDQVSSAAFSLHIWGRTSPGSLMVQH